MGFLTRKRAALMLCGALSLPMAAPAEEGLFSCAVLDISDAGPARVDQGKASTGVERWVELGAEMLVCGDDLDTTTLMAESRVARILPAVDPDRLRLTQGFHRHELDQEGADILAQGGRHAVVDLDPDHATFLADSLALQPGRWRGTLGPVPWNRSLVQLVANQLQAKQLAWSARVQAVVDAVRPQRWLADVTSLSGFNRYVRAEGIHDAEAWLVDRFGEIPGLRVGTSTFQLWSSDAANVVAVLEGHSLADTWFVVGGHYDSISDDPWVAAPGAEDNASGCAGVLEVARAVAAHPPAATVVFICYTGEELGLYGSQHHVDELVAAGDHTRVQAVLNMDMIGYTADDELDCLLETSPFSKSVVEQLGAAAATYTRLEVATSLMPGGSDHVPYLDNDIPAALVIENDWFIYPHYHTTEDLPEHLSQDMGAEIVRMVAATLAEMAGAGTAPAPRSPRGRVQP